MVLKVFVKGCCLTRAVSRLSGRRGQATDQSDVIQFELGRQMGIRKKMAKRPAMATPSIGGRDFI